MPLLTHGKVERMPEPVEVHGATVAPRVDRIAWRVRLKSNPRTRFWFRLGVGLVGAALVIAAPLTGWLPGPGGIPLFLAGLAVLSTEFLWAKRVQAWMLRRLRTYLEWSPGRQRLFWACFFTAFAIFWYILLIIISVPTWLPEWAARWLRILPGVD